MPCLQLGPRSRLMALRLTWARPRLWRLSARAASSAGGGTQDKVHLTLPACHEVCVRALTASGLAPASADTIAKVITAAERDEAHSHGLFRLPGFCRSLRSGRVRGDAQPEVRELAPSILHVDAKGAFAPVALAAGLPRLAERARSQGVATLAVAGGLHFSALWWEAEELAAQGLAALVFVNTVAFVAPHGGRRRVFGTNPMAFAWPRPGGQPPLVWDQASSVMARGDMALAQLADHELPPGCAVDVDGQPTTDPARGLEGAQCTFGGAKGSNIALMVELLAAGLTGGTLSADTAVPPEAGHPGGAPTANGELIIAMDPGRFAGDGLRAERVFELIAAEADGGARLPSARRFAARARTPEAGIWVPREIYATIEGFLEPEAAA